MNILVLSHLYPNNMYPTWGVFVQQEIAALRRMYDCTIQLVTPIQWAPPIFWWNPRWRRHGKVTTGITDENGMMRMTARYFVAPGGGYSQSGRTLYHSIHRQVRAWHANKPFDLIHAHCLIPGGYAGMMLGKELDIPVVCTGHGSDVYKYPNTIRGYRKSAAKTVTAVNQLIAVSGRLKRDMLAIGEPRREIKYIPNCVDVNHFQPMADKSLARQELGVASDDIVLVFVGSLVKAKGVFELLDAFKDLTNKFPNLSLLLIGDGVEKGNMEQIISTLPNPAKVRLVGSLPHDEVSKWVGVADIFVLPSYSEGLPCSITEAMAAGLPVIATEVGGIPEIIFQDETGLLIPPKESHKLAQAIESLASDPERRDGLGKNGRRYAVEYLSVERHTRDVWETYQESINAYQLQN